MDNIISTLAARLEEITVGRESRNMETPGVVVGPLDSPRQLGDTLWAQYESEDSADAAFLDLAIRATQIAVEISVDTVDPELLFDLGHRLDARYGLKFSLDDLDSAISAFQRAAKLTPDHDSSQASRRCARLGAALYARFRRLGSLDDLNGAAKFLRCADDFTPENDDEKVVTLANHAAPLFERFMRVNEIGDLADAIALQRRALALTQDDHPYKPSLLNNLGNQLLMRFNRAGGRDDLEQAVGAHLRATELTADEEPSKAEWCSNLGNSFLARFELVGELEDIEQAVSMHRRGVDLTANAHHKMPLRSTNLGNSLITRFKRTGRMRDLEGAIVAHRRAVELTPDGDPDKSLRLNNLGQSLFACFERTAELDAVEQAISAYRLALELLPANHPDKAWYLSNLGDACRAHFKRTGDLEVIAQAISAHRLAVESAPDVHPAIPSWHNNLGNSLMGHFEYTGELGSLEKSISAYRRAVTLSSDEHPDKPARLTNLGNSLIRRFESTGELDDLRSAISSHHRAIALVPSGHSNEYSYWTNLGHSLAKRFDRTKEPEDLESTLAAYYRALDLIPDGHSEKPLTMGNLCSLLCTRYERMGDDGDIESAITAGRGAIDMTPEGHPNLVWLYHDLAGCFQRRSERTNCREDLVCAISMFEKSTELVLKGHPYLFVCLDDLGGAQKQLFEGSPSQTNFNAAIRSFMAATEQPLGSPSIRLKSAKRCVDMLSTYPSYSTDSYLLLSAHSRIIEILPEIVWLGHGIHRRYDEASQLGELVNAAVSVAIAAGALEQAVEWLEAGRALIWSQVLSLRTPLDELQSSHPTLAASLRGVQNKLQHSAHHTYTPDSDTFGGVAGISVNVAADRHRGLVIEYEDILKDIRGQPGFEHFLRPKRLQALIPSSEHSSAPVVFINVHSSHCDALILSLGSIVAVPLPELTSERASQLRALCTKGLAEYRVRAPSSPLHEPQIEDECRSSMQSDWGFAPHRHTSRVDDDGGDFVRGMEYTWRWIFNPVLQALDLTDQEHDGLLPHLMWCPTGPLTQIPLHAAGMYSDPSGPRAYLCVVSSYIPSLSAFVQCVEGLSKQRHNPAVLVVTQPATPGQSPLPETRGEGLCLQGVLDEVHIACGIYNHKQATLASVRKDIGSYPWVHLACHGSQNREDATKSAFELYDGPLTLADLMGTVAENAELAFLSACQTAAGDERTPEESAHLAAGMLAVGFKGVIATTWSIQDADAPVVVDAYYKKLLALRSAGALKTGETGAAYALHEAIRALREKVGEKNFKRWVPFVHFGA